jgi:hypothetical protein
VARSAAVRRYAGQVWPALDPKAVLFSLLSDADVLQRHTADLLSEAERSILLWANPPAGRGSARWSAADTVLLDEIRDHLQRTPSLGHVVLDEAQDLSPMQLRAVGRRCSSGSATVLGDLAQGTTPWATDSWESSLGHLGKPEGVIEILERGFRVPASVIAPDAAVGAVSKALRRKGVGHGVLGADHGDVDHQVDVIPATVAKGLEFDRVIVVEPSAIATAEPDRRTGLRRLHIVLTRAVSELTVLHSDELPPN